MSALPIAPSVGTRLQGVDRRSRAGSPSSGTLAPVIAMPVVPGAGAMHDPHAGERLDAVPLEGSTRKVVEAASDGALAGSARDLPTLGAFLRWLAALGVLTAMGVCGGLALQPQQYAGPTFEHAVVAGESVWGLAQQVDSDRPLEQVVADIQRINGIGSEGLQAGQQVVLPAR